MILLDSDHLSVLRFRQSERSRRLTERLQLSNDPVIGTTVANVEESMRGWMATIAKEKQIHRQIFAYRELAELFALFSGLHIALLDDASASLFLSLKGAKLKVGTMDLKTAAIAKSNNATLLTANKRDFEQVPGLKIENWLDA